MSHLKTCAVKREAPKGRRITTLAALIALDPQKARDVLADDLRDVRGNVAELARRHGVSRQTMYRYLGML